MVEVYKIGVKLAMTSNHAQILGALAAGLGLADQKVTKLIGSMGKLKLAVTGAFAAFTGVEILRGLGAIVEKTKDLSHELAQIEKLGGDSNVGAAYRRAIEITRDVRGITQSQALHIYGQTYGLLGNKHALDVQELLAKYGVAMGNTANNSETGMSGSRDLVRAAEQMGRLTDKKTGDVDLDRFRKFVDLASRIGSATEGQVGAAQLYQLTQQAGPALMNMTDAGIGEMAILSQYMGSRRAGTALMSLNQQFSGGTMWTRNAKELERLGILHEGEWSKGGGGGVVLSPEARKRLGTQLTDPLRFVTDSILPAMDKAGITDPDDQIREIYSLFGRQTSQREIADLVRNRSQIGLELGRLDKGKGLDDQLDIANKKDIEQNLRNLNAAWSNLLYTVSQSDVVIKVLSSLTETLRIIDQFASAHGTATKAIVEFVIALGAGLSIFGGVAMIAVLATVAGVPVAIGAAVAGIATAVGVLIGLNWSALTDSLKSFGDAIGDSSVSLQAVVIPVFSVVHP